MHLIPAFVAMVLLLMAPLSAQTLKHVTDGTTNYFELGWSMAAAGDQNGDNVPDVVVGCPESVLGAGTVLVISLSDGSVIRTLSGQANTNKFGHSVDGGLDVNGDLVPDIAVGAPGWDLTHQFDNRGRAYVYSGSNGNLIFQVTGTVSSDQLGESVALIPDLNNDGRAELAVGAAGANGGMGQVTVYSGMTALPLLTLPGTSPGESFGRAISPIDDLNGDNVTDLLIGAPYNTVAGTAGRVYVLSGSDGSLIRVVDGTQGNEHMGFSLANLDDINGDQVPDFVVGAPDYDAGLASATTDAGRAQAVSGADGAFLWQIDGPHIYMKAGLAVDRVADIDGDGVNDVLVGMPYIPP